MQHRVAENSELVYDLLVNKGGSLYVCGDAKNMARDVSKAIAEVISAKKSISLDAASQILKSLRANGRFQEDVWS